MTVDEARTAAATERPHRADATCTHGAMDPGKEDR
jgi:hypothetical protein